MLSESQVSPFRGDGDRPSNEEYDLFFLVKSRVRSGC
jgi:hypothetical protein